MSELKRAHVAELSTKIGQKVKVMGHAETIRSQSSVAFVIVRDITGKIQCVLGKNNADFPKAKGLTPESVVEITGTLIETKSTGLGMEIQADSLRIVSLAEALPIPIVDKGNADINSEARMDWRFLVMRRERDATIMRVLSAVHGGYQKIMRKMGFVEIGTPKIMPTPSESRAELFKVDYFGKPGYLAQSPQLYKQMGIAAGLERIFEIGPLFRADPSFTTRHATEFLGMDGEMGYIDSFQDVMDALEEAMRGIFAEAQETCQPAVRKHFGIDKFSLDYKIPQITMMKAKEILGERGQASDDLDLNAAEEKAIGAYAKEKFGSEFVYITEFPWSKRPFYHKKGVSSDDGKSPISVSADLIFNGTEIATTAQREENYKTLVAQCLDKGLEQEGLQWYLDFFRYGMPPHGGWGLGSERIAMLMLDLPNIREVQFLYRGVKRLAP